MTIRVTVNFIPAEQFSLAPNIGGEDDQQRLLLSVPQSEVNPSVLVPASGAIAVSADDDTQPLSYAVPQLTGGW